MTSDTDLVELTTATTTIEAEWLVGALKGLGIESVTFGELLADEFAMSQKLMGLSGGVRVMVPRTRLDAAREALAEIERERPSPEEFAESLPVVPAPPRESEHDSASAVRAPRTPFAVGTWITVGILLAGLALVTWLYVDLRSKQSFEDRLWTYEWKGNQWQYRWKDSGNLSLILVDRDRDGVIEETWQYDRWGRLQFQNFDADQNGVPELVVHFSSAGAEISRDVDENENGFLEYWEFAPKDGVKERVLDLDEDGHWDRREFIRVSDDALLDAFKDGGRKGSIRVH